jgi:hypothetical protein
MMTDRDYRADDKAVLEKIRERLTREDEEHLRQEYRKLQDRRAAHAHENRRPDQ